MALWKSYYHGGYVLRNVINVPLKFMHTCTKLKIRWDLGALFSSSFE